MIITKILDAGKSEELEVVMLFVSVVNGTLLALPNADIINWKTPERQVLVNEGLDRVTNATNIEIVSVSKDVKESHTLFNGFGVNIDSVTISIDNNTDTTALYKSKARMTVSDTGSMTIGDIFVNQPQQGQENITYVLDFVARISNSMIIQGSDNMEGITTYAGYGVITIGDNKWECIGFVSIGDGELRENNAVISIQPISTIY